MNEVASQGTLPHLLFYGPPGTGKTSTILALARELFGPVLFRSRILELNASDERGIAVIREKVKSFAKVTVKEGVPDYPCPPFKLIILDEADSLTSDAQTALRRVIEQYSRSTRFCLICNYVSRIIDPLTSRCAKFRFGPVSSDAGIERLGTICREEGVRFEVPDQSTLVLSALMDRCGGDLRRAVTLLQGSHRLGKPLSVELIDMLAGSVPQSLLQDSLNLISGSSSVDSPQALRLFVLEKFARAALPSTQFLHQLVPYLLNTATALPTASCTQKALILDRAAGCEARICDGADETIQLLDFFMSARMIMNPHEFKIQTMQL